MALPLGSILSVPFRRTHNVSLSRAIKDYISSKYGQHPDMFADDLSQIDELRRQAVAVQEPHSAGVYRLQAYAAQLVWMGVKFPVDLGADFIWYPSLGYDTSLPMSQNSIRFELANILYNLAALYCSLAVQSNTGNPDGLKAANNHFCRAAGVISHLKSEVIPDMRSAAPEDMDEMTLDCLESLFLAQAQECFWQKAIKDGMKDASIARLAVKVSDLYLRSYDFATKSNTISSEWIHHISVKHNHFAAAAQYRAACDCLEKRKYGEEIARLRDAVVCANNALKESRYVNKILQADLQGLKDKVQDDLRRAERDNDAIYLSPVPPKSELKALERASMVSAQIPKEVANPMQMLGDAGELGRTLFTKLVPYSVHVAASIYANRRDQTINSMMEEYEALTASIHAVLQSLNLPGSLQALEKPLGLPPGIIHHAEEIRQQNGPGRLARSVADVDKLKQADRALYNEGVAMLRAELGEDESARRKYGTERWKRPPPQLVARRLYDQVTELEGYLGTADRSDATVRDKLRSNEPLIKLLASSDKAIEDYVPSSRYATITPSVQREIAHLRAVLDDETRIEARRRRKMDTLRLKAQSDDVKPELLKEASRLERDLPMCSVSAADFEDFFDKRLTRYDEDRRVVETERVEQDKTISRIREAQSRFATARRGDDSTKSREQALQRLESAYFAYKEIVQNLDVGRKFYNELAAMVTKFVEDCKVFAYNRRTEAAQLESDIANALPIASLSLAQAAPTGPPTTNKGSHSQKAQNPRSTANQTPAAHRDEQTSPLPAPIPVKPAPVTNMAPASVSAALPVAATWDQQMPIRFANVTTAKSSMEQSASKGKDTRWDPSKGFQFGANA